MHSLNVYLQYLWSGKAVSFMVLSQSDSPIDTQKRHLSIIIIFYHRVFFCNLAKIGGLENILPDIGLSWNFLQMLTMTSKHCKKVWAQTNFVNVYF